MIEHRAFFGDGEKTFALPFPMIKELERQTEVGIGALFHRVRSIAFNAADLSEIIRLGLIGGGMKPSEALTMVQTYVEARPLGESLPVAMGILSAMWLGTPDTQGETRQAAASGDLAAAIAAAYEDVAE